MNTKIELFNRQFYLDIYLVMISATLIFLGYIMVVSSSLHLGEKYFTNAMHYPNKQLIHIIASVVIAVAVICIPLRFWEKWGAWFFILGLFLLAIVLINGVGIKVNGSMRWLSIAGVRIQVSELVKLFTVIYMAGYVIRHQESLYQSAYGLLKPLILFSFTCVLLLLEPDFGSSVVIMSIVLGIIFLSGARIRQFIFLLIALVVVGGLLVYSSPYRLERILAYLNPWGNADGNAFQLVQALIAFGRGEIFGVGLGNSLQKMFYLPEAHTDFIFSVLAEELGLIGVIAVIVLYTLWFLHAFAIAEKALQVNDKFAAFLAYGLGLWFGFQSFINMGVNMGVLPTKGITLPLMSYGGGSMVTMCVGVALLVRVHSEVMLKQATSKIEIRSKEWVTG